MLRANGAVPVLAHPSFVFPADHEDDGTALKGVVAGLKEAGLAGVEVYYKDYTPEQVESLAALARDLELIPCGGTDYHASGNPGEPEPGAAGPPLGDSGRAGGRAAVPRGGMNGPMAWTVFLPP